MIFFQKAMVHIGEGQSPWYLISVVDIVLISLIDNTVTLEPSHGIPDSKEGVGPFYDIPGFYTSYTTLRHDDTFPG